MTTTNKPISENVANKDAFISYSRVDINHAGTLMEKLDEYGGTYFIDWQTIITGQPVWETIAKAIESTHTFVIVLTSNSLKSHYCHREIAHAIENKKRIIPILCEEVKDAVKIEPIERYWETQDWKEVAEKNWKTIQNIHWVDWTTDNQSESELANLFQIMSKDPEHVKLHTKILTDAITWTDTNKSEAILYSLEVLESAEKWLNEALASQEKDNPKEPQPTELQVEFISESRKLENQRRQWRRGTIAGIIMLILIAMVVGATAILSNRQSRQWSNVAQTQQTIAANAQVTAISIQSTSDQVQTAVSDIQATASDAESVAGTAAAVAETSQAQAEALEPTLDSLENRELSGLIEQEMRRLENPEIVTLLGIYGFWISDNPDVDSTLTESVDNLRTLHKICPQSIGEVRLVDLSPDGRWIVAGDESGNVYVIDTESWTSNNTCEDTGEETYSVDGELLDLQHIPGDDETSLQPAVMVIVEDQIGLLTGDGYESWNPIELIIGEACDTPDAVDCFTPKIISAGVHPTNPRYLILGGEQGDFYIWDRAGNTSTDADSTQVESGLLLDNTYQLEDKEGEIYLGRINEIAVSALGESSGDTTSFVTFGGANGNVFVWELSFNGRQFSRIQEEIVPDLGLTGDIIGLEFGTLNNYPTSFVAITGESELTVYDADTYESLLRPQRLLRAVEYVLLWDNPLISESRLDLILAGPDPGSDIGGLIEIRTYNENGEHTQFLQFNEHTRGSVLSLAVNATVDEDEEPLFALVSGDVQGEIRYWDLLRVRLPQRSISVNSSIGAVSQLAIENSDQTDPTVFASGAQIIKLDWDDRVVPQPALNEETIAEIVERDERSVQFIELLQNDNFMIAVYDSIIRQYNQAGDEQGDPARLETSITSIAHDSNANTVYVGTEGRIRTFALSNSGFSERASIVIDENDSNRRANALAVAPTDEDEHVLAAVGDDIHIYSISSIEETSEPVAVIDAEVQFGHENIINAIKYESTGNWVVSADNRGRIVLWSANNDDSSAYLQYVAEFVSDTNVSINAVDIITHKHLFQNHDDEADLDDLWIVAGWDNGAVQLWKYSTGESEGAENERNVFSQDQDIRIFAGHSGQVTDVEFFAAPDSEPAPWIFSSSTDGTIRRWDVQTRPEFICYAFDRVFRLELNERDLSRIRGLLGTSTNTQYETRYAEVFAQVQNECPSPEPNNP